jgi:hypothetical protein
MLLKEVFQDGSMATPLVVAVAANRKVGGVRQRRQQSEQSGPLRLFHLGSIPLFQLSPRSSAAVRLLEVSDDVGARRKIRKPDVVEVEAGVVGFRDAPRWAAHRADAKPFVLESVGSELHDSNGHVNGSIVSGRFSSGRSFGWPSPLSSGPSPFELSVLPQSISQPFFLRASR